MKIRVIVSFIIGFVLSVIISAGCSALTDSSFDKSLTIGRGGSEKINVDIGEKGSLTYDMSIDSSEGVIYVYDSKGRTIDTYIYTGKTVAQREIAVTKGKYTIEITRSASSTGSGDITARIGCKVSAEKRAAEDMSGMIGVMVLLIIVSILYPRRRYGYGYGYRYRWLGDMIFGRRRHGGGNVHNVMLFRDDFDDHSWF